MIQAPEEGKIHFFKKSYKSYDENKDGFVTTDEYYKMELESDFERGFDSLISWGMTKALIQFELDPKLYTPSTLNIDFIQWHTQLNVCAVK